MIRRREWQRLACGAAVAVLIACNSDNGPTTPGGREHRGGGGPVISNDVILIGAGDIAYCDQPGADVTSKLILAELATHPNAGVFTSGDNAYPSGGPTEYKCYDATWGRFKNITRPAAGNHDYENPGQYYSYFGSLAGPANLGYYAYDLGGWRIIVLNSNTSAVPVTTGSTQMAWLRDELASHHPACSIAIWHHPLFSSGPDGVSPFMRDAWRALYDANVDIIINGHEHMFERFKPLDPDGGVDLVRGIRQFTVGTGGAGLYTPVSAPPTRDIAPISTWGVLMLTLENGYRWKFLSDPSRPASDEGIGVCH